MSIRHSVTQMTAARLVVLVVSSATFMAVSRLLPPETFGLFLAIVVVTEFVTAIADFGISAHGPGNFIRIAISTSP